MNLRLFLAWIVLTAIAAGGMALATKRVNAATEQNQHPAAEVSIDNYTFNPPALTIAAGTTVTWTNRDDVPHTVVSTTKVFKSSALDTDDRFSFTFDKPGTYAYFCGVHPMMTGKIVVK